jgi:FkbM family methyltransferase
MKVYYFDMGLFQGVELGWMVNSVFPALGIENYEAYGFEAFGQYANKLQKKHANNDKVTIIHKAIAENEDKNKLYFANNRLGHSIFSTKRNVTKKFEEVDGIVFSNWISENIKDFDTSFNILKVNIEGAEWFLFNDLVNSGLHKNIDIFCGAGHDVEKVSELSDKVEEYYNLLENNNIFLHRYTEYKPHNNADIKQMIREKYVFSK